MADDSLPDQMERYESVALEAAEAVQERDELAHEVGRRLADHVEGAVAEAGTNVETVAHAADGHQFRLEARLDRAALVAALTDALPGGFVVSHLNDDGSLSIEWTGGGRTPGKRERGAILKAIVAEETESDSDGLIRSVPTVELVLDRADELGIDRDEAEKRLERLATLDVVDLADGEVYPDENFSRI
jgi:hypothetical protein